MTPIQLVRKLLADMQKVGGENCNLKIQCLDPRRRPDDFEIHMYGTCNDKSIYEEFKKLEGKYSVPFKYPNFVSRQNAIGLLTVADKASAYPGQGGSALQKAGGDFILIFCFVEW